jgi:hypothetical protein
MVLGVSSSAVGVIGGVLMLVRQLAWGKDWDVGGYG